jgi:hypothetical protein
MFKPRLLSRITDLADSASACHVIQRILNPEAVSGFLIQTAFLDVASLFVPARHQSSLNARFFCERGILLRSARPSTRDMLGNVMATSKSKLNDEFCRLV